MTKVITAKFVTQHGDVYWAPVDFMDDALPTTAQLEQYAGAFRYDHGAEEEPVYREVERATDASI